MAEVTERGANGRWQIVLDVDQVTPEPLTLEALQSFMTAALDLLAEELHTTGWVAMRWVST